MPKTTPKMSAIQSLTSLQSLRAEPVPRRATGPTTDEGKAISSQNGLRHGLSAAPPTNNVRAWFNVILNNDVGALEEPNADDPRRGAALRLALAEVRYHRACKGLGHRRRTRIAQKFAPVSFTRRCAKHSRTWLGTAPTAGPI